MAAFDSSPYPRSATLRVLSFEGTDDVSLVKAIELGQPRARALLYDRYHAPVRRVLARVLGVDQELPDLLQEVFVRAFSEIGKLESPERLGAWLTSIAVFTAREQIRRRQRSRWLTFFAPEQLPEGSETAPNHEAHDAMRATYATLERLPVEERILFALRFLEGMELTEIAASCQLSLATVKRRLARAHSRFSRLAERDPVLRQWMHEGDGP